ncbi:PPOX class F420-dependent oxidoreductase [Pseudonocardia acaciae]|uniref:PPOX class F420-dependent oxidoreductase n=1 Tax=Pseudonocardia acaciae TaxID=551276 RepID=UPI0004902CD3|nr:PPOX class F420-dependent oxidoreductase [Pseudonocardia acaciae]
MTDKLPERAKELLDGTELVVLTTLNADGSPHSTPIWALRDGDDVLMSTVARRVKARNLERDPRASVVVIDPENPVRYFSINGSVAVSLDEDRRVLDQLSIKYMGKPYPPEDAANVRVVLRLTPSRVTAQYEPAK